MHGMLNDFNNSLCLLGLLAAITTAAPEKEGRKDEQLSAPPPVIRPVTAEVVRGGAVEIIVRAMPRGGGSARILLRSSPRHGRLQVVPVDGTAAQIIYVHDGGDAREDEFLVAAQSPTSPVSASVKVAIKILEPEPVFEAPSRIGWPTQFSLEESVRELTLRNTGGGVIEGEATADAPWEVLDGGRYNITAGGSQTLRVCFKPDSFRQFTGVVRYSGGEPGRVTRLDASVIQPLSIEPLRLDFERDGAKAQRALLLSNASPQPLEVVLVAPAWVIAPEEVVIPAEGKMEVPLRVGEAGKEAEDDLLVVSTGGYEQSVRLVLPAQGPVVQAGWAGEGIPPARVGTSSEACLILSNTGAQPARIELSAHPPLSIADGTTRVLVEPGSEAVVRIAFQPEEHGRFESQISLNWEGGQISLPVSLLAEPDVEPAEADLMPVPSPATSLADGQQERSPQSQHGALARPYTAPDAFASRRDDTLPRPTKALHVVESRQHEAIVEWKPEVAAPAGLFFEIRALRIGQHGLPEFYWIEYTDAQEIKAPAGLRRARLRNLYAGSLYAFRLSAMSAEGKLSQPVDVPYFATATKKSLHVSPLMLLGFTAVVFSVIAAWRRWGPGAGVEGQQGF